VHSLRFALLIVPALYPWAAAHYEASARALATDVAEHDREAATKPIDPSLEPLPAKVVTHAGLSFTTTP
jgi:hypothetical protein